MKTEQMENMAGLRKKERTHLEDMNRAERSSQMWLNVDDVLKRIPLSRSWLWKAIENGQFPKPRDWKGTPLWSQGQLRDWMEQVAIAPLPKRQYAPATWDLVKSVIARHPECGLTNRQIAFSLGAAIPDVAQLTRMMAIAGEVQLHQPLKGCGLPNFYTLV